MFQQPDIDYDALADEVRYSFSPLVRRRDDLRRELADTGWICTFDDRDVHTDPAVSSLAAVDGAKVRERFYLQDILAAVGGAANGQVSPAHPLPPTVAWTRLLLRHSASDKVLAAAMAAIELFILDECSHELRILDGGFITPLLGLRDGLQIRDDAAFALLSELFGSHWNPLAALEALYGGDEERPVVAVTKADTGRGYVQAITADPNITVGATELDGINDRALAAHILNPGEYLTPIRQPHTNLHIGGDQAVNTAHAHLRSAANDVSSLLAKRVADGTARTLFFKPHRSGHAVIKIDYLTSSTQVHPERRYVEAVNQDCRMPHALEPYSQWKVDALVKQVVSDVPGRVRRGVMARFDEHEQAAFGPFLNQKHRT